MKSNSADKARAPEEKYKDTLSTDLSSFRLLLLPLMKFRETVRTCQGKHRAF